MLVSEETKEIREIATITIKSFLPTLLIVVVGIVFATIWQTDNTDIQILAITITVFGLGVGMSIQTKIQRDVTKKELSELENRLTEKWKKELSELENRLTKIEKKQDSKTDTQSS